MRNIAIVLHLIFCLTNIFSKAQVNADFKTIVPKTGSEYGLRELMESLVGQGIVLKNYSVTRASATDAFGFFEDNGVRLGIKKGLLMTSGGIKNLAAENTNPGFSCKNRYSSFNVRGKGMNEGTYPELSKLLKGQPPTFDACVIELDIVPTSDTLSFNYIFASEEYDEYVGSQYNDVFGFFISGKGIDGDKNLAVVPGTEIPVSINTINNGNNTNQITGGSNPSFYVRNTDGHIAIEYDGLTRLMEIRQHVIPYETYHLKIAIADVADDALDSGVLIEGQSFISYEKSYNVLFDPSSTEIEQGYRTLLDNLLTAYKNGPEGTNKFLITGHTDGDGTQEYNDQLSAQRASEVHNYLKNHGIDDSAMLVLSKGENMPRADNYNAQGKQLNRRVEIKMCGSLQKYQKMKTAQYTELNAEENSIKDNYPNPFNNSTTIRAFVKPEISNAYISVLDLKGNLVKTIYVIERGNVETYFGAEDLSNTIYVATLVTDGNSAGTIKLVVKK